MVMERTVQGSCTTTIIRSVEYDNAGRMVKETIVTNTQDNSTEKE